MFFNSITFLLFFLIFFILYWFVFNKKLSHQNLLLLFTNYVFYAIADWRLLLYLFGVSVLNFYLGIYIERTNCTRKKNILALIGVLQGVGGLIYFKYFNFFIGSFNELIKTLPINLNVETLQIIIPIGISFYTFKTISYIVDVKNDKINATKDWVVFFNYVSFFPTLLSGPIDKAKFFIPQIKSKRQFSFEKASNGMRQILWGLLKKIVIADSCAIFTTLIFDSNENYSGSTLLLGGGLYAIQVYADFSGYSDMAIGFSRLLGFNVTKNFNFPFFAQNIADFWRRWHISLTSWLTEYVFTPLSISFRDYGKLGLILAILINFTLCGMWHGANWTYIIFGFLHGLLFIPLIVKGTINKKIKLEENRLLPSLRVFINITTTFILIALTFIIFRMPTITGAWNIFSEIFTTSLFKIPEVRPTYLGIILFVFMFIEWIGRNSEFAIEKIYLVMKRPYRIVSYYIIILILFLFSRNEQTFIYFQF